MLWQRKKKQENTLKYKTMAEFFELIGCIICAIALAVYLVYNKDERKEVK